MTDLTNEQLAELQQGLLSLYQLVQQGLLLYDSIATMLPQLVVTADDLASVAQYAAGLLAAADAAATELQQRRVTSSQ